MNYQFFTSESVCAGHPDKICDQISDAILDEALKQDRQSRVAVETLVTVNQLVLAGEVTSIAKLNYEKIARKVVKDLGYTEEKYNFCDKTLNFNNFIHSQSSDISIGVDKGGAGDQGMMFGYAARENKELMPIPIVLAHKLAERIDKVREGNLINYLRPDGKTEVTVRYEKGKPVEVTQVVLAVPYDVKTDKEKLENDLFGLVVEPALRKYKFKVNRKKLIVNGTGKWEIGGPASDTGVTGRKIIVDTYGGMGRHGGGCFSGKDPSKVDRSGAYACRYLAKNIVAAGLADRVEVKVAYVIGKNEPIEKDIETFGTARVTAKVIKSFADKLLDLSVGNIMESLDLKRPIYKKTACYGHFGRNIFPWEKIVKF